MNNENNLNEDLNKKVDIHPTVENKEIKDHYVFILESVYDCKKDDLEKLDLDQLKKLLEEKQQNKAKEKSYYQENPNKFWMIKGMPKPKEHKVNSSTKGGLIVFLVWLAIMILIGVGFMIFAFVVHK